MSDGTVKSPPSTVAARPAYTVTGTAGSYGNNGHTAASALAGGYFDAPVASGAWVGVDYGVPTPIASVTFAPRPGWPGRRLAGGVFQGRNAGDAAWTNLYTINPPAPVAPVTVPLPAGTAYSSYRYVGPGDAYCNIAGLSFNAPAVKPTPTPTPTPVVVPVVTPPVVVPPIASTVLPLKVGVGTRQTTAAGTTIGMAPVAGWGDLRSIADVTTDEISWDFGDTANAKSYPDPRHARDPAKYPAAIYSPNTDLHGAVEGYVYEQPGKYTITATVRRPDGSVVVASNTVTVAPDTRAHQTFTTGQDAAFVAFVNGKPNVWATVAAGATINVPDGITIRLASGAVVEGVPAADGTLPVIVGGTGSTFDTWTDGVGIVVRRLAIEGKSAPMTWAGPDPITFPASTNIVLSNRACGVSLYECQVGTVGGLYKGNTIGNAGVLVARNVQLDRTATSAKGVVYHGLGVSQQFVAEWSGGMQSWQGNDTNGSVWQSLFRSDGVGACDGFSFEFNRVVNNLIQRKAGLTNRNGSDAYLGSNVFVDAVVGASSTIGSKDTRNLRYRYHVNCLVRSSFEVGGRAAFIAYTVNHVTGVGTGAGSGYGFSIGTDAGLHDMTLAGNTGESAVAKVWGPPVKVVADSRVDNNGAMTIAPATKTVAA